MAGKVILAPTHIFDKLKFDGTQPNTAGIPTFRALNDVSSYPREITKLMESSNEYD